MESAAGDVAFLKWGTPAALFREEARSLAALGATGALRVPAVLGVGVAEGADGAETGWLLLEWLDPAPERTGMWAALGRGLARLHRTRAARFGWPADNFIGPLPQENSWAGDWAAFWWERRLAPQLRRAYDAGYFSPAERRRFERLGAGLAGRLAAAAEDGPSLLHGDLWSGNVHPTGGGVALVDPSSYHGHREVDLAMSELFGGFGRGFHEAYREEWPLAPGYARERRPVYQLYYLLVHVNLFGAGYVGSTLAALAAAG